MRSKLQKFKSAYELQGYPTLQFKNERDVGPGCFTDVCPFLSGRTERGFGTGKLIRVDSLLIRFHQMSITATE